MELLTKNHMMESFPFVVLLTFDPKYFKLFQDFPTGLCLSPGEQSRKFKGGVSDSQIKRPPVLTYPLRNAWYIIELLAPLYRPPLTFSVKSSQLLCSLLP